MKSQISIGFGLVLCLLFVLCTGSPMFCLAQAPYKATVDFNYGGIYEFDPSLMQEKRVRKVKVFYRTASLNDSIPVIQIGKNYSDPELRAQIEFDREGRRKVLEWMPNPKTSKEYQKLFYSGDLNKIFFHYNKEGLLAKTVVLLEDGLSTREEEFHYDPEGNCVLYIMQARRPDNSLVMPDSFKVVYDSLGRMVQQDMFGEKNQYRYSYKQEGNVLKIETEIWSRKEKETIARFTQKDSLNGLGQCVKREKLLSTEYYKYDLQGNCIEKRVVHNNPVPTSTNYTTYAYNSKGRPTQEILARENRSNLILKRLWKYDKKGLPIVRWDKFLTSGYSSVWEYEYN